MSSVKATITLLYLMLGASLATGAVAAEGTVKQHGNWYSTFFEDQFTGNKGCYVLTASDLSNDKEMLLIPVNGRLVNEVGEYDYMLGAYSNYPTNGKVINSSKDIQILIDDERVEFASNTFFNKAKNGSTMMYRVKSKYGIEALTVSLNGFTAAWQRANDLCK